LPKIAIAVNYQARVVLSHEWRIERRGNLECNIQSSDIPGNVPFKFGRRQPKISEPAWNAPSCMVNSDDEYGPAVAAALEDRRWFIRAE
jgi:hypothetical protein